LEHDEITLHYLLLGSDIRKSISPAVQNAAFLKTGFDGRYDLCEIAGPEFRGAVTRIRKSKDVGGFNITAPYKEKIIPYLARLDSRSRAIGAVNTVKVLKNGNMVGYNTDVDGIQESLKKLGAVSGRKCVVLGAGGAARACVYTALKDGYNSVTILNRTLNRAKRLVASFDSQFPRARIRVASLSSENLEREIQDCKLLINAVTNPFPFEVRFSGAQRGLKFLDLGYKGQSSILASARKARIRCMNGVLMLVEQGASSFEIWTGRNAPRGAMLAAARRELAR
jgi:shikimate dehydrogenase